MGCGAVYAKTRYAQIPNRYKHPDEITDALIAAGLTESQLIIGIDFSRSNLEKGKECFDERSLHEVSTKRKKDWNPYQQAFGMVAEALAEFDADQLFPVYGFGDSMTGNSYVFSFEPYDRPVHGLEAAVQRYKEITQCVALGGPTSLTPIIRQAISKIREAAAYSAPTFHVLLILTDGQISQTDKLSTELAITEASQYPLSIVCVGVGDGPWKDMEKYDDSFRRRKFDNFQFLEYNAVFGKYPYIKKIEAFATHALQAVPDQYTACRFLGYLKNDWEMPTNFKVPPRALGPPDKPNIGDPSHGVVAGWTAVYHHALHKYFYMNRETMETLWDKPVLQIYKPPVKVTNLDGTAEEEEAFFLPNALATDDSFLKAAANTTGTSMKSMSDVIMRVQKAREDANQDSRGSQW